MRLPPRSETVHEEFLRSLTRERYGGSLPRHESSRTVDGPTRQWNLHVATVEADELWQQENDEEEDQ